MRCVLICIALSFLLGGRALAEQPLHLVQTIALDDVEGRIDHMAVDLRQKRLYVAALGNNTVEIIDLKRGKRVGTIHGTKEPQGVTVLPQSGAFVIASGGDDKCRLYDTSKKLRATIGGLDDADNTRYDPAANLIYVGYGEGALAVIDPHGFRKVADIQLDGHPESFQIDTAADRVFVNVPDARQIAVIDRSSRKVLAKWPLSEASANFPMALDESNHRLFVGCRSPAKLLVLDSATGGVKAQLDCPGDVDDLFYDDANKRHLCGGWRRICCRFRSDQCGHLRAIRPDHNRPRARTALFVPTLQRIYVAIPHRGSQAAQLRVFQVAPRTP